MTQNNETHVTNDVKSTGIKVNLFIIVAMIVVGFVYSTFISNVPATVNAVNYTEVNSVMTGIQRLLPTIGFFTLAVVATINVIVISMRRFK